MDLNKTKTMEITMKVTNQILLAVFALFFITAQAFAQEGATFQTTKDEMVRELTRQPVKYRSFAPKKRAITVVSRKDNGVEENTIMINEQEDIPRLKLKIEFDYNSAALKPTAYPLLQELAQALLSPSLNGKIIMINGHTDSDGTQAYNLNLSFKRAESVKAYLAKAFTLPAHRLKVRGFGESLALVANTSSANKQINRRVEFEISQE